MELKLVKAKDLCGVCFRKVYAFGPFHIKVLIDLDGTAEIEAKENDDDTVVIRAINKEPAMLHIEQLYLQDEKAITALTEKLTDAKALLIAINSEREKIVAWEEKV